MRSNQVHRPTSDPFFFNWTTPADLIDPTWSVRGGGLSIGLRSARISRLSLFSALFFFSPPKGEPSASPRRALVCVRIERSSFDSRFTPGRFAVIQCGASTVTRQRGRHAVPCSITRCCLSVSIYLSPCAGFSRPLPLLRSRASLRHGAFSVR